MPSIWKAAIHTSYCPSVSCIIFWHWYNLSKKERASKPVPFSLAKIPIKKIWVNSEDWMLPPQWKPVFIQQEDWFTYNEKHGTAADRSPPSGDTMFSGHGTSRGGFLPSCGIKKIPHIWYKMHFSVVLKKVPHMWYKNEHRGIKRYHICGTFCTHNKKGLFSDSPFCFLSASAR